MKIDPITFAVIKGGLDSIADDMAYTVIRIARSEIVKDVMDFSAALCAADGQMVAQAKTIAQHLGAIPEAMASGPCEIRRRSARRRCRHHERPLSRRNAFARRVHVRADFRGGSTLRIRGRHLPSHRRRRPRAGFERLRTRRKSTRRVYEFRRSSCTAAAN